MITTLIIISLALVYLGYESKWFTVRLLIGTEVKATIKQAPKFEPIMCRHGKAHYDDNFKCHKLPARTIKMYGSTLTLVTDCNICRANVLKDVVREHKRKTATQQLPLFKREFIYQVRVGSHHEYVRWNNETNELDYSTKPRKGYLHRVVEDYNTNYNDCLPGKAWLEAHHKDEYPEATIDISIDGKTLSVNGDYKRGMIKEFVKANKLSRKQVLALGG